MRWAKTVRLQSVITIGDEVFSILCESEFDEDYALYINNEYIKDVKELPSREEVLACIDELEEIEERTEVPLNRVMV